MSEELLAAIYAAPDDDAPRAVYADWLSERGDPRGEFIALQLAKHRSAAGKAREAKLVNQHAHAWAGALREVLQPGMNVFERGFLCRGAFRYKVGLEALRDAVMLPAWALFDVIDVSAVADAAFQYVARAPWLRRVRELHGLTALKLLDLRALEPFANLAELTLDPGDHPRGLDTVFPQLRLLRLEMGEDDSVARLLRHPLPVSLGRIHVLDSRLRLAELADDAHSARLRVPVLAVVSDSDMYDLGRDRHGRYTKLTAHVSTAESLAQLLTELPDVTELVVKRDRKWDASDDGRIEALIALHSELTWIAVPWRENADGTDVRTPAHIELWLQEIAVSEHIGPILDRVMAAPLWMTFDSLKSARGLEPVTPADVRTKAVTLAGAQKRSGALSHADAPSTMYISQDGITLRLPRVSASQLESWLRDFLGEFEVGRVFAPFLARDADGDLNRALAAPDLLPLGQKADWIRGYDLSEARIFGGVDALDARLRSILGLRVIRTPRNFVIMLGEQVERVPTPATVEPLELALIGLFWTEYERTHGFALVPLVTEILPPGDSMSAAHTAMGHRRWQDRRFLVDVSPAGEIELRLEGSEGIPVATKAEAVAALETLAAQLRG